MNQQMNQAMPKANRNYKDTLFRMIFRDEEKLLNLFNAVNHTQHTDVKELEIKTLENAIYMNVKNECDKKRLLLETFQYRRISLLSQ